MSFIGHVHPKIFKFLQKIKHEQSLQELNIAQIDAGMDPSRTNKKNLNLKVRMLNVVKKYKEYNVLDYLRNVAHNISI